MAGSTAAYRYRCYIPPRCFGTSVEISCSYIIRPDLSHDHLPHRLFPGNRTRDCSWQQQQRAGSIFIQISNIKYQISYLKYQIPTFPLSTASSPAITISSSDCALPCFRSYSPGRSYPIHEAREIRTLHLPLPPITPNSSHGGSSCLSTSYLTLYLSLSHFTDILSTAWTHNPLRLRCRPAYVSIHLFQGLPDQLLCPPRPKTNKQASLREHRLTHESHPNSLRISSWHQAVNRANVNTPSFSICCVFILTLNSWETPPPLPPVLPPIYPTHVHAHKHI